MPNAKEKRKEVHPRRACERHGVHRPYAHAAAKRRGVYVVPRPAQHGDPQKAPRQAELRAWRVRR